MQSSSRLTSKASFDDPHRTVASAHRGWVEEATLKTEDEFGQGGEKERCEPERIMANPLLPIMKQGERRTTKVTS